MKQELKKKIKDLYFPLVAGTILGLNFLYIGFVAMAPGREMHNREKIRNELRIQKEKEREAEIERLKDLEAKIKQKAELYDREPGLSFKDKVKLAKDFGYKGEIKEDYSVRHPWPFFLVSYPADPVIIGNNSKKLFLRIMGELIYLDKNQINDYLKDKKTNETINN